MTDNFTFISQGLLLKLNQVREFIKRHNPTIGILTEEILRSFLKEHMPKFVSVEQGFVRNIHGETSRQCDIIIYDSTNYAPFYRINDIVIVPEESVIAVIEVKTAINNKIFHDVLDNFTSQRKIFFKPYHLFIFDSTEVAKIERYFSSYKNKHGEFTYDHDTYQYLPDQITGINKSYHLKKDFVDTGSDTFGYSSFFYRNQEGTEINALQHFYLSLYHLVEIYMQDLGHIKFEVQRDKYFKQEFSSYFAFGLFKI